MLACLYQLTFLPLTDLPWNSCTVAHINQTDIYQSSNIQWKKWQIKLRLIILVQMSIVIPNHGKYEHGKFESWVAYHVKCFFVKLTDVVVQTSLFEVHWTSVLCFTVFLYSTVQTVYSITVNKHKCCTAQYRCSLDFK